MLAGKKAFEGESISDTLASVMRLEPDWSVLPEDVPASIQKLVRRCLTKDRKQRLQAIGEARIVLENRGATEVTLQAESTRHPRTPWVIASVVLTVALAAVSFVYFRQPPPAVPQVIQFTIDAPPKTNIRNFAISPDGRYVAMTTAGEGNRMWVRPLDSLQAQALVGTEGATSPFWSPDSLVIGFFAGGKLRKISVTGGPAQTIENGPAGTGTWNSEGVILIGSTVVAGLHRVSAVGGVPSKVTGVDGGTNPTFLPDGRRFLYEVPSSKDPGIYLGSLDARPGSQARRIIADVSNAQYLPPSKGSPHGYIIFVRDQTLMVQPVDPISLQPAGDVFPVIEQVSKQVSFNDNAYDFSISRNGTLLHRTGSNGLRQYTVFDRDGNELSAVGGRVNAPGSVALSPDQRRLASVRGVGRNMDLWITELERGSESRFTFGSRNDGPVWSPDGNYVAFASDSGGSVDLYRKPANQAGPDELLWHSEFAKVPTDWCCDGRFIIFIEVSPRTKQHLFALPLNGDRHPIPLLQNKFIEAEGTVSPDGRWLAYVSNESGNLEVYVQPFGPASSKPFAGKWPISIGGGRDPRWRGDGREMFYVAPNGKMMAVAVKTDGDGFAPGTPRPLFETRIQQYAGPISRYAVSADGKRFLMAPDPETSLEVPLRVTVNWLAGVKK